jgi:predicted nucleic acid-binding protein
MSDFIDSNLILRFLLDDPGADKVERLLKGKKKLILTDVTIAEIVWVLGLFYKWNRKTITDAITGLINLDSIVSDQELFLIILKIFKTHNVDFIDAYLAANLIRNEDGVVYSYDRDFDKIPKIKRAEPK